MRQFLLRRIPRMLLGALLTLLLMYRVAQAACGGDGLSDFCSANFGLVGDLSAVSSAPSNTFPAVDSPQLPMAGPLFYADYKALEAEARTLLERNLTFRQDISPYQGQNSFDQLVRQYDIQSGFDGVTYDDPDPSLPAMSLQARIDQADRELRQARNLYAYLAVFAPVERMRNDDGTDSVPGDNYKEVLCAQAENPNPPDPTKSGQVLDPIIDWCNFGARLRQSVREAAYIRMIFAQEFMVDALGLQFGSNLLGGEAIVRKEVAQLEAAYNQLVLAEERIAEAVDQLVGNGCFVSDFFEQADWALLSRIAESGTTAQQHIAMRLSYLNINQPADVERVKGVAIDSYRKGATEGYLKMMRLAGLALKAPNGGCAQGTRPDGTLVAGLAVNLMEGQRRVRELTDGRNIFGFDVNFTPARPFYQEGQTQGLWNEAMALAESARRLEENVNLADRAFDLSQEKLLEKVQDLQRTLDMEISNDLSCSRSSFSNDDDFFACAEQQMAELNNCLAYIKHELAPPNPPPLPGITTFDQCVARVDSAGEPVLNAGSTALQTLAELRNIFLEQYSILERAKNIDERIRRSNDRNATVTKWLGISGAAQTAADVSSATVDLIGALDTDYKVAGAIVGGINIVLQGVAGALSTQADIEIANAENSNEIENLLLDQSELLIDALVAQQAYAAKLVEFEGVLGHMEDVILQTQRQRAHLKLSPGNDPSYRMLRDSYRLSLADALAMAAKVSYLAARRAEYEYAARLSASNFRISDIYRARTAGDIIQFLNTLRSVTNTLGASITLQPADFKLSVAQHVLGLTDAVLTSQGFTTPEAIAAERTRRFRQWVAQNTVLNTFEPPFDNKPVLRFSFTTSVVDGGVFSQLLQQNYDRIWLLQMGGVGAPVPSSTGLSVNLVSTQSGLSYRTVAVTQDGLTHLRARSGCVFDFRLMSPAALLGSEWASNQDPAAVTAVFKANVNAANPWSDNYRSASFQGRPVSATNWQVLIKAGAPEAGMTDMDLQQLTDIELNFSTVYANRTPGVPALSECTRIDY
jgi:hypothetical protein